MKSIRTLVAVFLIAPLIMMVSMFASATAASATTDECVNPSTQVLSHVNNSKASITVTLSKRLCKELNLGFAGWTYKDPSSGQWPQNLQGMTEASIQDPGTITIVAPEVCGQRDLYYGYGSKPQPPKVLYGPQKPYEPPFLHKISKGSVTYNHDDPKSCIPQDIIMPKATANVICEAGTGQTTGAVQLISDMTTVPIEYATEVSDGQSFTNTVGATKVEELTFQFTGTVTVKVTARYGEQLFDVLEQTLTDEGCALPPTVVVEPRATIGQPICVAAGNGKVPGKLDSSQVFIDGGSATADELAASVTEYQVVTSAGYSKRYRVPAGQIKNITIPLVEDKTVTVRIIAVAADLVIAERSFKSDCDTSGTIPPSVTEPPTPGTPPTLAETGVREIIALIGAVLLALGFVAYFGYDPIVRYISRRRIGASAS